MGKEGEFQEESHGGLTEQDLPEMLDRKESCGESDCTNNRNEAESAWIGLMSAVPKAGQNIQPLASQGVATPPQAELDEIVRHVRPDSPELYALDVISEAWESQVHTKLKAVPGEIQNKMKDLASGWSGGDFDRFQEICEETFTMHNEILDEIKEAQELLANKQKTLLALQGGESGGEVPFPPPQFWMHSKLFGANKTIHIRPAFHDGHCQTEKCNKIEKAMEAAGLNTQTVEEVEDYRQTREDVYYERYTGDKEPPPNKDPFTKAHAREMAQADADDLATEKAREGLDDYENRSQTIIDDIVERREMATDEISGISFKSERKKPPIELNPEDMDLNGMTPGSPGGMGTPPTSPMEGLQSSGPQTTLSAPPPPDAPTTESALNAGTSSDGAGGDVSSSGGNSSWTMPADPDDEEAASGGLLSGGVGGGAGMAGGAGSAPAAPGIGGAGAGAGAGAAAGAGGGLFGPGAGAGAGAGAGGAGRGGGGMGSGMGRGAGAGRMGGGGMMGGGGRGPGDTDDEDKEDGNWLVEDDDVWGLRNPEFEQFK